MTPEPETPSESGKRDAEQANRFRAEQAAIARQDRIDETARLLLVHGQYAADGRALDVECELCYAGAAELEAARSRFIGEPEGSPPDA